MAINNNVVEITYPDKAGDRLGKHEKELIALLTEDPACTYAQLAQKIGISKLYPQSRPGIEGALGESFLILDSDPYSDPNRAGSIGTNGRNGR